MQVFTDDDIDFNLYAKQTECSSRVRSAGVFTEEVIDYFHGSGPQGSVLPWSKTHEQIQFRPAEVTLWSGMNGHGKSLVLGQMCMGFVAQRQSVCLMSFEMRPVITLARICRQATGTAKPSEGEIRHFHDLTDPFIWLYDHQGSVTPDIVMAVIRFCAKEREVKHVVIDSFMKCGVSEDGPSAFNDQKKFMDQLCSVAKDTGVHIHIVAHSRKQKDELSPPGKMDVKGSGSLTDQVDNVVTVWRNKAKEAELREKGVSQPHDPDCILVVDKQRNGEWEGKIGLWFNPASLQFSESINTHSHGMMRELSKAANGYRS